MDLDRDTFLVTVYCVCDDLYQAELAPQWPARRGAKPQLSDSEVLTLALLAQWEPHRSQRAFLRYAREHLRPYFPGLTSPSAFHRRVQHLGAALGWLGPAVAQAVERLVGREQGYQLWDGLPIPLMRRCRGQRRRLFGCEAGFGRGGSDQEWYYGMHALVVLGSGQAITGWVLGPADTAEYWLVEALLRWRQDPAAAAPTAVELAPLLGPTHGPGGQRQGPSGPLGPRPAVGRPAVGPYLSDLGCRGQRWRAHWQAAYGAVVLTKADYQGLPAGPERGRWSRWLAGLRQDVETAFSALSDQLGAKFPRARSQWGAWIRFAAKVAAYNCALYVNHCFGRPPFALFNPLA